MTVDEIVLSVGSALGRADPLVSSVELRDNRVENNGRFGLDVYARAAITATGNRVLHNGGIALSVHGLGPLSEALITANRLGTGGRHGLYLEFIDTARVRDNIVFSHPGNGIFLRATPGAVVVNNLAYANGTAGIAVGPGDERPTSDAQLTNNTLFANGFGVDIGRRQMESTGTLLRGNIVNQNYGGVRVAFGAQPGTVLAANVNTDGTEGVPPGETDLDADPLFVDPDGADGILGEEGWADDDFRLRPGSPASDGIGFRYP